MKRSRRSLATLAALVAGAFFLEGCSSDKAESSAKASSADSSTGFCPKDLVLRKDMARYLVKLRHDGDSSYAPPAATGMFADVPSWSPDAPWIEELSREGVTNGCRTNAQGQREFCPSDPVPREQMAAFIVRLIHGGDQNPAPIYTFTDLPTDADYPFAGDIQQLAEDGITTGCQTHADGTRSFCPKDDVPREQMAAFLMRAVYGGADGAGTGRFPDIDPSSQFAGRAEQAVGRGIMETCQLGDVQAQANSQYKSAVSGLSLSAYGSQPSSIGDICSVLGLFRGEDHPYFFTGAYGQAGAGVVGLVGADFVLDLWNQQAAMFWYGGGGLATTFGGDAGGYVGWAYATKPNVIQAWSGSVYAASLSVGVPFIDLAAGASGFVAADGTVFGGAAVASIGFDVVPTVVDGSVTFGVYTPWNTGTQGMAKGRNIADDGAGNQYIQFGDRLDMAHYCVDNLSIAGPEVAATVIAISIARDFGGISRVCGW